MYNLKEQQRPKPVLRTLSTPQFALSERYYGSYTESPLHRHVKTYIIITLDGRYVSTFDSKTEEYRPWTVTYLSAGASHSSRYPAEGAKVLYIELPSEVLKTLWQVSPSHLIHFSLQDGLAVLAARQLYNELNAPDFFSSALIDGYILQMLARLARCREARPQSLPTWLGKAHELIRHHFAEPLALGGIAKSVRVHPVHLAREYRRYYNCSIGEQIRRLRIEYACDQLSSTDHCLSEIALASGFSDQSHFTVSFKQQIGMVPSQYRKTLKSRLHL